MFCRLQTLQSVRPGSSKWLRSWKASGTSLMVKLLPYLHHMLPQSFDLLNPSLPNVPILPSNPGFSLSPHPHFSTTSSRFRNSESPKSQFTWMTVLSGRAEWEDSRTRAQRERTCHFCNPPFVPLFIPALQSPIEYQRRESQTNSLGRPGASGVGSPGRIRPGHRAQVGTHTPINGSLPSLLMLPKGEVTRAPLPLDTQV